MDGKPSGATWFGDKGPGGEPLEDLFKRVLSRQIPHLNDQIALTIDANGEATLNLANYQGRILYFIPHPTHDYYILRAKQGNSGTGLALCLPIRSTDPVGEWYVAPGEKEYLFVVGTIADVIYIYPSPPV